ncbi:hypothetical protein [Denitrobacterium detoxificans]|jgi:uncharacterized membrane protein|uniref:hypothetical protein n=1 Tax=Denitrobacterium detoxificans TaxID=79604 RepID=UPI0026F11932|nr:hypothetical protein [Denitrobacterium detoxificans]MBE6466088.1 hypothetical protein [Denitrobacterium detoxificans]
MERSGSQKVLLVLSIIEIVGAALSLITGILFFVGAGAVLSDASVVAGTGTTQGQAAGIFVILSCILIVEGIWSLLCGIFGIRAANDNQKIMIVWVFCLIGVIMAIIGIIAAIANGQFGNQVWSLICSLAVSGIMFFIANNIKKEAGK